MLPHSIPMLVLITTASLLVVRAIYQRNHSTSWRAGGSPEPDEGAWCPTPNGIITRIAAKNIEGLDVGVPLTTGTGLYGPRVGWLLFL